MVVLSRRCDQDAPIDHVEAIMADGMANPKQYLKKRRQNPG